MLKVQGLCKEYDSGSGTITVLRDVDLAVEAKQTAVVMGPSGSGKSTLLNILGTLEVATAGRFTIDGTDLSDLSERELARFRNRRIGLIFQDHHLLPQCSALENVILPTLVDRAGGGGAERAKELLHRVGLSDRLQHLPSELSGGERQRVAIARALVNEPALILADEPTGNLDRASAVVIADLLAELQSEHDAALVLVTHSEALAERFDGRYELLDGRLVAPQR